MRQGGNVWRAYTCAVAVSFGLLVYPHFSAAGVRTIGTLYPTANDQITPRIQGIAFDGSANPLVFDPVSWTVNRVSLLDASVQSTATIASPPPITGDQFVYDATSSKYFTLVGNQVLNAINLSTLSQSYVGGGLGAFFNFAGLSIDSSGALWIATDNLGGELWSVNKQTGVASFHATLHLPSNFQVTSLAIGPQNQFLVFGASNALTSTGSFFWINPTTGAATPATSSPLGAADLVSAMAYDAGTGSYYGVVETRSVDPRQYTLVQVTGLPEPTGLCVAMFGLAVLRRKCPQR